MKLLRRVAVALAALLVVVIGIVAVLAVTWVRRPFPVTEGEVQVPGLTGKVTVVRGDHGIPQIYADSSEDLFKAEGFVHAQDRFFEMDLRRHITAGRLSELVGPAGLETDKVVRTMGWRRVAEEELPTLEPRTRQLLQAYADGVNRYLRGRSPGEVSAEYSVLGLQLPLGDIEEWTPVDSLAWLKAMAWDLRGDYSDELTTQQWLRVIAEAAELGVLQLHLSGGEPLLRRDLVDIVRSASEYGLYTNLITSASGLA